MKRLLRIWLRLVISVHFTVSIMRRADIYVADHHHYVLPNDSFRYDYTYALFVDDDIEITIHGCIKCVLTQQFTIDTSMGSDDYKINKDRSFERDLTRISLNGSIELIQGASSKIKFSSANKFILSSASHNDTLYSLRVFAVFDTSKSRTEVSRIRLAVLEPILCDQYTPIVFMANHKPALSVPIIVSHVQPLEFSISIHMGGLVSCDVHLMLPLKSNVKASELDNIYHLLYTLDSVSVGPGCLPKPQSNLIVSYYIKDEKITLIKCPIDITLAGSDFAPTFQSKKNFTLSLILVLFMLLICLICLLCMLIYSRSRITYSPWLLKFKHDHECPVYNELMSDLSFQTTRSCK
ncbi:hypothetical protein GJ496_006284 [Pomphorhynchus laevis]|nr:hypothetical protein GJ496_006284 [Pomphorhynchus laevis]